MSKKKVRVILSYIVNHVKYKFMSSVLKFHTRGENVN